MTAFKTITVRSQVDGRLDQVLFREGQTVKAGDRIAQIDPRPFLNQLHQAEGALARDRAQLKGAKVNLERFASLGKPLQLTAVGVPSGPSADPNDRWKGKKPASAGGWWRSCPAIPASKWSAT